VSIDLDRVSGVTLSEFVHSFFAADDALFFRGASEAPPYCSFRDSVPLAGTIRKPTGSQDRLVHLYGSYSVDWRNAGAIAYFCIEVRARP
jgi:hypothetical protein